MITADKDHLPMRRRTLLLILFALAAVFLAGCAASGKVRRAAEIPQIPAYSGPKARIAVSRFDYKAAKGDLDVGVGLATMLTTELVNSGRFIVLERENLQDILSEQDLAESGRITAASGAPIGEIIGAELLVMGAVTAFEPEKMGIGGALLGGATIIGSAILHAQDSNIPIVGAAYKESYLAMDIRLVDTASGRVLSSLSVEGKAADMGGGILFEVGGGKSLLPMVFGGWQKSSVEKAMRISIARAVEGIVANMPAEYYRHKPDVLQEGELMGYSYLAFPAEAESSAVSRSVELITSHDDLDAVLNSWGLPRPAAAGDIDFSSESLIAVTASYEDRGAGLGIQKIVNDRDAVRVEIGIFPPVSDTKEAEKTKGEENILTVPFLVARVSRSGKPLDSIWITPPAAE